MKRVEDIHPHYRNPREGGDLVITRIAAEHQIPAFAGISVAVGM
jgi:hypothetical protein